MLSWHYKTCFLDLCGKSSLVPCGCCICTTTTWNVPWQLLICLLERCHTVGSVDPVEGWIWTFLSSLISVCIWNVVKWDLVWLTDFCESHFSKAIDVRFWWQGTPWLTAGSQCCGRLVTVRAPCLPEPDQQRTVTTPRWSTAEWNQWQNEERRLLPSPPTYHPLHQPPQTGSSKLSNKPQNLIKKYLIFSTLDFFSLSRHWDNPPRKRTLVGLGRRNVSSLVKGRTVRGWRQRLKTYLTLTVTRVMISTSLRATLQREESRCPQRRSLFSPLNNWLRVRLRVLTT